MSLVTQKCRLEWEEGTEHLQVKSETLFLSFFIMLSSISFPPPSSHPLPLLCLLHSLPSNSTSPILACSFFSVFYSLPLLCGIFCGSVGAKRGLEDRGLGSFSPTHKRAAAGRHRRPRLWNRFSLQIGCASCGVFVFPSPTSSSNAAAGVGCWKQKHAKVH